MADIHKIVYVCVSHAVLDVRKVFLMCNGIVFQCFGVFWAIYRVVLGCLIRDVLYKAAERDKFSNLERVLRYLTLKFIVCMV